MQTKSVFKIFSSFRGKMVAFTMILWAATQLLSIDWLLVLILPTVLFALHGSWLGRMVVDGAGGLVQHAHEKALGEWTGNYYQWGYQQIRIIENEGHVWVVDEDLINATGMKLDKQLRRKLEISYKGYSVIPGTKLRGFNEMAVLEFLNGKQDRNPEVIKLKLWFERQVFFPLRNKREMQKI